MEKTGFLSSGNWAIRALRQVRLSVKRGSIRQAVHFLAAGHAIRRLRISRFMRGQGPKYLQVGGGPHNKAGRQWINGDILFGDIYLNAAEPLPFADHSFDVLFTEHFIEHLPQEDAVSFMAEAFRVLKPGGVLRQSTPGLEQLIAVYQEINQEVSPAVAVARHMRNHRRNCSFARPTTCQFVNDIFRLWGHQFIYDRQTLQAITEEAGFGNFRWVAFGCSDIESLRDLERHADEEWMKNGFTMICEAEKMLADAPVAVAVDGRET